MSGSSNACLCLCVCVRDFSCACVRIHIKRIKNIVIAHKLPPPPSPSPSPSPPPSPTRSMLLPSKYESNGNVNVNSKNTAILLWTNCMCVRACVYEMCTYFIHVDEERKKKNYYIRYLRKNHDNIVGISYFNDVECTSARHRTHQPCTLYWTTQMEMQRTRDTYAPPNIKMMNTHKNCNHFLGYTKMRIAFCVRLILYIKTVWFWSSIRIHFYLFNSI